MANPVPNKNDGDVNRPPTAHQTVLVDGAINVSKQTVFLTKAGALAATLGAPSNPGQDGQRMDIISKTAQAHVITATNLINGNDDTLTFGGAIGDCVSLFADGGEWTTGPLINITVG